MKKIKELDEEINNIIYASERGAGFGGGTGQEEELDRRVQALQRRQGLVIEKRNSWLTLVNVVVAILNLALLAYQVFFIGK